ncbi:hypothetical protein F5Y19DRAFT_24475 [Xylariaceae sp. FL1651]|nr:hypothetical protein F5Y19DRAFT_24475 [Xylariaceae sp. FL1651]
MAAPVRQPALSPSARCGDVTSRETYEGELALITAIATIDAQPTTNIAALATERSNLEGPEGAHGIFDPIGPRTVAVRVALTEVTSLDHGFSSSDDSPMPTRQSSGEATTQIITADTTASLLRWRWDMSSLDRLPNEILMHILGFLDVSDLLATSRINHHFRTLSVAPILHTYRLQRARTSLPPLLTSPSRPTLAELIARRVFLTHTTQISRRLARNLVAIRLSRRLPQRPSAETLVQRGVLPPECVPNGCRGNGCAPIAIAPALVAKRRAVEKEKLKDGLRRWVGGVWRGEVEERAEGVREWEERAGVGRVWRLRRFWERVGRGDGTGGRRER